MLEEPRDIDYMRRRKLDTGREFAVWNFTVGYCMNAADALSLLRAQANENANDGTADLATIKKQCRTPVRLVLGRLRRHRQNG